jgi:hypothetical protein
VKGFFSIEFREISRENVCVFNVKSITSHGFLQVDAADISFSPAILRLFRRGPALARCLPIRPVRQTGDKTMRRWMERLSNKADAESILDRLEQLPNIQGYTLTLVDGHWKLNLATASTVWPHLPEPRPTGLTPAGAA